MSDENQGKSGNSGQGGGGNSGPGGGNPGQGGGGPHHGPEKFQIQIDRDHFTVTEKVLTGAQLRKLPNPDIAADRDLFEVVPGAPDRKIGDADRVQMKNGLRFFTAPAQINPGSVFCG